MPKAPSLPIAKLPNGRWLLTIPESFTGTGKRRRPSFDTKSEAETHKRKVLKGQEVLRLHSRL
ncbi:hypothetical protein N8652_00200 [bacterium]|nr:hypothetical protein [bacterium]